MKKTFLNIATVAITTLSLFSCHKKTEDPTPTVVNNNNTTPTNPVITTPKDTTKKDSSVVVVPIVDTKKLNFNPINQTLISDGSLGAKGFTLVPMVESDSIYTVEVVSTSTELKVEVNPNHQLVFTPPNNVYSGTTTLTITLKSGKRTITKQMSVSYGTAKQIATYDMLKPYFGKLFKDGEIRNLYIYLDGTIKSDANGNFYSDANGNGDPDATGATYIINDNGNIYMDVQGVNVEYKVEIKISSTERRILFTNVMTGNIKRSWFKY